MTHWSKDIQGDANSTTTSAVAQGTIEIRENPTQDISALSRDTANSLNELGRIFDKQKIVWKMTFFIDSIYRLCRSFSFQIMILDVIPFLFFARFPFQHLHVYQRLCKRYDEICQCPKYA